MIKIYDNGGSTADRYTIEINTGDVYEIYTSCDAPASPQGVWSFATTLFKPYEPIEGETLITSISDVPALLIKQIFTVLMVNDQR